MCLGDLRFMPYVRWEHHVSDSFSSISQGIIPRNPSRVSLIHWQYTSVIKMIRPNEGSFKDNAAIFGSYQTNTGNVSHVRFDWKDWGDILHGSWSIYHGGMSVGYWSEATVPLDIMQEIRSLGIK